MEQAVHPLQGMNRFLKLYYTLYARKKIAF